MSYVGIGQGNTVLTFHIDPTANLLVADARSRRQVRAGYQSASDQYADNPRQRRLPSIDSVGDFGAASHNHAPVPRMSMIRIAWFLTCSCQQPLHSCGRMRMRFSTFLTSSELIFGSTIFFVFVFGVTFFLVAAFFCGAADIAYKNGRGRGSAPVLPVRDSL